MITDKSLDYQVSNNKSEFITQHSYELGWRMLIELIQEYVKVCMIDASQNVLNSSSRKDRDYYVKVKVSDIDTIQDNYVILVWFWMR